MIDYLMQSGNMNGLQNSVGKYNPDGRGPLYDPTNGWRADVSFLCQVTDYTNPASPKPVNGVFCWVALPSQDSYLSGLPGCWVVANRELAIAHDPNYLIQTTLTPAQRAAWKISPVVHGAHYPFQG